MTEVTDIPDDEALAAEYALGLLEGDVLAHARARFAEDASFRRTVRDWEARLATLADELPQETPSPGAKKAIMKRLFADAPREAFWRRLGVWQGLSAGLAVVTIGLGAVLLSQGPGTPQGPLYSAEIASTEGDFRVVATVDTVTEEVFLALSTGTAPEGRILQVWAHGPDEPAMSVGLWPEGDSIRLPLPAEIAAVRTVLTLGVSEEPPGGSVTGRPSGRVFGTVDIPLDRNS